MKEKKLRIKYWAGRHWENHPIIYAETFTKFLKENNFNGILVDAGCSSGRDVDVFSKNGFDVIGIDISEDEIAKAKANFPSCKFEVQNIERLCFENNSIDAFFMINVIHFTNKEKTIKEIFRTLKHGGYFFIHFNISITSKEGKLDYYHSEEDILKLISGFKLLHKIIFERVDINPVEHTHKIMELILQKP